MCDAYKPQSIHFLGHQCVTRLNYGCGSYGVLISRYNQTYYPCKFSSDIMGIRDIEF